MSNAVKKNIVAERLISLYGTAEQVARYNDNVLPTEEFMEDCVRPLLRQDLKEYNTLRRFKPHDYGTTEDKFKVLEVAHTESGLTEEQYASLRQIRVICSKPLEIPGLQVERVCTLVEKHVYVDGKRVEVFPLVLVEVTCSDPQKRGEAVVTRRRIEL